MDTTKIRIVLAGLRGEDTITELCRQAGIAQSQCSSWSKEFFEADKKRIAGDTAREARDLKEVVAEQTLELRLLKKICSGRGRRRGAKSRLI